MSVTSESRHLSLHRSREPTKQLRVCVVGPSTRFLSGITYYTFALANALSRKLDVSAILMRRLLPTPLYPGSTRVGADLSSLALEPSVARFDGVDWSWYRTLPRAMSFLDRQRPDVLVLEWWTGTVLHTYLALATAARARGARIVVEFHETLDPGETRLALARRYVALVAPRLFHLASGYVVHSEHDRRLVSDLYGLPAERTEVIPHATYDHYRNGGRWRAAPPDCCNLLYFGVIRPFKGLEDLIRAYNAIPPAEISRYWLTVVGETWEGWTLPAELIARSRYRDRITFVNRYVSDREVDAIFGGADVVVLPYRRSSQSGPLHIAMNYGLPVVVTDVGGLGEAVRDYDGAALVEPANPDALRAGIENAAAWRDRRFRDPRSWAAIADRYSKFLSRIAA